MLCAKLPQSTGTNLFSSAVRSFLPFFADSLLLGFELRTWMVRKYPSLAGRIFMICTHSAGARDLLKCDRSFHSLIIDRLSLQVSAGVQIFSEVDCEKQSMVPPDGYEPSSDVIYYRTGVKRILLHFFHNCFDEEAQDNFSKALAQTSQSREK